MSIETVDKRFALIARDGDILFAYRTSQKSTDRHGFALTAPREKNRHGVGTYTNHIEEVVRHLVFDGWKARVTTVDKAKKIRKGSMGIGMHAISGYWIADELRHLVKGAKLAPSPMPRSSLAGGNHLHSTHNINSFPERSVAEATTQDEKVEDNIEFFEEDLADSSLLADLEEMNVVSTDENDPTERLDNRMSRIGQGKFRRNTIAAWGGEERCAVTGIAIREVLTASHIIPWSKDVAQRKRGSNGILLTAHLDRLFDRHLIGFKASPGVDVFSLVVAPRLADRFLDLAPLGLTVGKALNLSKVKRADRPRLETNLRAHLEHVLNNK